MSATAIDESRLAQPQAPATPSAGARSRSWVALGVSLSGLAVLALAVGGFIVQTQLAAPGAAPAAAPESAAHRVELPDVGIAQIVYEPGHSSGWHVHAGVHSVVVLSGALTVYDQACGRQEFLAGQTYLGGSESHVARNEGGAPAELAVTYVYTTKADPGRATAPPSGCDIR